MRRSWRDDAVLWLLLVAVAASVPLTSASYEEDITLTAKEKAALDKFKALVFPKIPRHSYVQNYKNDDLYWIRWLRARQLDIPAAERMFLNHLKWRETEKIDTIAEEDWTEFERDFPLSLDGVDRQGRPTAAVWTGDWNPRRAVLSGKSKQFTRWIARMLEIQNRQLYKARAEGRHISQCVFVAGLEDFSLVQHACAGCLPIYATFTTIYESHYPNNYKDIYMVDMPPSFEIVLNVIRPFMSPATRKAFKTYSNKAEWKKVFDQRFDRGQRDIRFGGTRDA